MSAPSSITLQNLTGEWVLNKKLSDDTEPIFALQGMNWMMRKAIGSANVTVSISESVDENGVTRFECRNVVGGKPTPNVDVRQLDWQVVESEDQLFGKMQKRSRWVAVRDLQDPFLSKGWAAPHAEKGFLESVTRSADKGWESREVWGFQVVNGERRYVRQQTISKKGEKKQARLVYDFKN